LTILPSGDMRLGHEQRGGATAESSGGARRSAPRPCYLFLRPV